MDLLRLKNVTKSFANKQNKEGFTLTNINLTFKNKGMVFIKGKSGSGKSTILNIIANLEKIDKGKIIFNGKNITNLSSKEKSEYLKNDISIIFQHYNLFEDLTLFDNLKVAGDISGLSNKELIENANKYLNKFELDKYKNKLVKELSGGEKQRLAIIRSLIKNPKLILCDEPTGALDNNNAKITMDILKDISKDILVIVVSHNNEIINEYADEIITIKDGRITSKEIINEIENKSSIKKKKHKNNKSSFVNKFINLHLKKNLVKNMMMIFSSLIGTSFLILSVGFDNGSKLAISNYQLQNLENYVYKLYDKEYESVDDSFLSLVKLKRPKEEDISFLNDKFNNIEIDFNYSYLLPEYVNLLYKDEVIDQISFIPIKEETLLNIKDTYLLDGSFSFDNDIHNVIVNKEFIDKFKNIDYKIGYKIDIDFPVNDKERAFVNDRFVLDLDISINGVIKEFSFMNTPKIYYSYDHFKEHLSKYKLKNISSYLNRNYYSNELVESSSDLSLFSSYSYLMFLKDNEVNKAFSLLEEYKINDDNLSIENKAYDLINAYDSLTTSFIDSMHIFVVMAFIGVIFILGISTYSCFVSYKKERAILSTLGINNIQVFDIFFSESLLLGIISSVLALIFSFPLSKLLSKIFYLKFGVENMIVIPFLSYLNIPYFVILLALLIAITTSFISTFIPFLVFKKNDLVEELKDE